MQILECPWCGATADMELQATPEGFYYVQIRCSNRKCFAVSPHGLFSTEEMSLKTAESKAIKKWNQRAPKKGIK